MENLLVWQVLEVFLACDCHGVVLLPEGYASTDSGATTGFRLDGQFSTQQTKPLAHDDQAYSLPDVIM